MSDEPPAHNLDVLRSILRERDAAVKAEGLAQAALDHSRHTGERVAVVESEIKAADGKLDRVLDKLNVLTLARPIDRWLQRIALFAVIGWIAYQAWPR